LYRPGPDHPAFPAGSEGIGPLATAALANAAVEAWMIDLAVVNKLVRDGFADVLLQKLVA
jgi:hypothetical protein